MNGSISKQSAEASGQTSPTGPVADPDWVAAERWVTGLSAHYLRNGSLAAGDAQVFASLWDCVLRSDLPGLWTILGTYSTYPEDCIHALSAFAQGFGLLVHDWGSTYMAREGHLCLCLTVPMRDGVWYWDCERRYTLNLWTCATVATARCDFSPGKSAGVYPWAEHADPYKAFQVMSQNAIKAAAKRMSEPSSLCYRDCQIRYESQRFNEELCQRIKNERVRESACQEALAKGRVAYWVWLWRNRTFWRF